MLKIVACCAAERQPTFAAQPQPLLRSRQRVCQTRYVALPTLEIAVHAMMSGGMGPAGLGGMGGAGVAIESGCCSSTGRGALSVN